jgi:hypothetical protein
MTDVTIRPRKRRQYDPPTSGACMSTLATAFVSRTNGRTAGVRLPRLLGRFAMSSYIALVVLFLTVPVLVVILESFDTADYV